MSAPLPRILVVEDNPQLADNLAELLGGAGYAPLLTSGFQSALAAAREGYAVALVDLKLPDGEGTTLSQALKEAHPLGEVVLMTGFASVETAAAAVRAGAFAYLVKPSSPSELLLTIEQALRHVRLNTEKAELKKRAQRTEKLAAVGTLMAGLSHEIRNPLNAASLQLSVVQRRVEKLADEALKRSLLEPLALVKEEITRLDHTLEDFLQFARPQEIRTQPIDMTQLLVRVVEFLNFDIERRGLRVERRLAPASPLSGDESRLRQVLMNLLLNALDATPRGGCVTLSCHPEGTECVVTVDDTGPGVPEAQRERIFEPFYTTKAGGSGLGLPIVNAIVTQHGGTLTVGDAPEGGARFTLRLPAQPVAPPTRP